MKIIYRFYDRYFKCDAMMELEGCTKIPTLDNLEEFSREVGDLKSIEIIFPKICGIKNKYLPLQRQTTTDTADSVDIKPKQQ